ncbi:MAG: 6-carboxytetrahydropterin synthase [Candidatus Sumerlaeia bacterium]|nr:6-carboxytetrahydropterin synthase [Candidatus Sumerlaeia bacterium]
MEKIVVKSHFHTGHRQIGYPGHCQYVHGHTWRGKIIVTADEFPRDDLDMSLDFGDLKRIMRFLDHKMLVTENDKEFAQSNLFEPEGVVVLKGKGPSVENVATYIFDGVVAHIGEKFPGKKVRYNIEVEIQETDNNFFSVIKEVTI